MASRERQTPPQPDQPELTPNPEGTLDGDQADVNRQAARLLAQWAVQRYLSLRGENDNEDAKTPNDQVPLSSAANGLGSPLPSPPSGDDGTGDG